MERQERKENSIGWAVAVTVLVCVAGFLWLIQYSSQVTADTAQEISELYMTELTTNTIEHFNASIRNYFVNLDTIASAARRSGIDGEGELEEFLGEMRESYDVSFLALVDEQGRCHNSDGVFPAVSKISFLGDLLSGKKGLLSYNETILGDDMLALGTSFAPFACQDTRFVGILMGLETSALSTQLALQKGGTNVVSSIVTASGSYVVNNSRDIMLSDGANVFSQLERHASFQDGHSADSIREDFAAKRSSTVRYRLDGQQQYLCYVPIPNTDWVMLATISYSSVSESVGSMSRRLMQGAFVVLLLTLGLLSAIFVSYYITIRREERGLREARRRAEDARSRAEEALEIARVANEAKSTFLSNMSHDIRTPMNAIVGLSTMLAWDADDPEKVREHVRKIAASSQHLLSLINDVLDMSKIESGKTTLNIGEINLAELVEEIGIIIRPQAREKQQNLEIVAEQIRNEQVLGDKLRINQILLNLLSNAVKYTQPGGNILFRITQLRQDKRNYANFRFEVQDNGRGMSEEYQKVLFDPFTREIDSVTNKVQGTGLGMPITKNLVELMGGAISVRSKPGEGSLFTVELELRLRDGEIDQNFWTEHGVTRLLVVDDEADALEYVAETMAGTGVGIHLARGGAEAVELTRAAGASGEDFDLILLDWKMPGMDGLETARAIRQVVAEHVPIMVLTAYDWSDIEEEALSAGINGFLPKPFFLSSFKRTVEKLSGEQGGGIEAPAGAKPPETQADVFRGRRFLAAEDNELNAEILSELLNMVGATVDVAPNGREAVELFRQSRPGQYDAILMDVQMPVMNGYEAARAIRTCGHPAAEEIRIIAMTANAFAEDVRDALASGMDAHVAKPIDLDRLEAALRAAEQRPRGGAQSIL